ncbi:unnamed protein product [Soboliphyme baturini]|uniref:CMP/dCMP-type deaminase domain-containing protein n=1 Tax=Soboliphyme baturini TaxID=241478 RepID=A0A183IWS1_9BILA|nr:unnamed protein product [Soboliphyme baturini]
MDSSDEKYLRRCLELAREALAESEVPVGCVVAYEGVVIGEGRNRVNEFRNATRHAEMVAFDHVISWTHNNGILLAEVLPRCTLYANVEPCIMCSGAIVQLNIGRIVYGCNNERFGGFGTVLNVPETMDKKLAVKSGLFVDEAIELLKKFYAGENPNAPESKCKRKKTGN